MNNSKCIMHKLILLISIISIISFAFVSCSDPGVDKPVIDLENENVKYDAAQNTIIEDTSNYQPVIKDLFTDTDLDVANEAKDNFIIFTFHDAADILKKETLAEMEAELKKFLVFYTYDNTQTLKFGEASALTELSNPYSLEKRMGEQLVIRFANAFTAQSPNLVYRIKANEYTFHNGRKLDLDYDGVPGEEIYDCVYHDLSITGGAGQGTLVLPNYRDPVVIQVSDITVSPSNTDTYSVENIEVAVSGGNIDVYGDGSVLLQNFLTGLNGGSAEEQAIYDDLMAQFASNLKIQEFTASDADGSGTWANMSAAVTYDTTAKELRTTFTAANGKAYRVVFERGNSDMLTTGAYFGVRKKVYVTDSSFSFYNNRLSWEKVVGGNSSVYYNTDTVDYAIFNSVIANPTYYYIDSFGANKQLKVTMSAASAITKDSKPHFFAELTLDNFKNNVKFYVNNKKYDQSIPVSKTTDYNLANFREIEVTAVKFEKSDSFPDDGVGFDTIIITLDPNFKTEFEIFVMIDKGFGYADGKTIFSSPETFRNKGIAAYGPYNF